MADEFIAQIKAKLDTSEAEKKLSELTKNEKKVKLKAEIGGKKEIDGLTDSIEKANKSTKNLDNSFKSISTAKIKYDAFKLLEEQCKNAVASVKQLNDAMTLVNMTMLDMPDFKLKELASQSLEMAKDLSTYTKTVTDAVTIYANANESVNSIIEKAQPTVLLASASNMQASKAADTIQGIINQFDLLDSDAMRVADSIEKLSSEISLDFSKGISTISEAIGASGSVMNEAGLSFEKYGAIVSATAEQTRQSGNSLGTAFKTIASRLSRSKDGETSTEDMANAERALNSIGVSVRQQDGTFRDLSETLNDLYVKWGTLNNIQKSYISEEAAGIRNKNVFIAMMDTYGRSLELEKSALESSGTAMEINEKRVDSIDGKMQKLSATMTDMYNNAVSDDAIKGMLDFSTTVIEVVDNLGLLQGSIAAIGAMGLSSMVGKISANWQSIASMLTSPTTLFAVGIGAAVSAWSAYQRSVEESINSAQEAATAWSESNDSIQSQIDKITELRTALDSGTLSEQEAYQAKSDLFDIQQSLTESYGSQVAGIDLVNGSLREQISVLEELTQAEANKFLNENRMGIAEAEKQMTKQLGAPKTIFGEGGLFLTQLYTDGTKASDVLQEIFNKYQDFITMEDAGDGINTNVYFNGNAEDAENVLGQLMTDIRNAEDEIGSSNIFKQLDTNVTNGYNRHTNNTSSGGGSPVNGTANVGGTAYASGNWGNPKTQTVLIGELGREIVVDPNTGRWQTYGDNGAEFATIPKNAIIFNHLQSESLLERGFVNGRGTIKGSAMVGGTAFAFPDQSIGGGGKKGVNSGSNYSSSSSSSSSISKTATKTAKTVEKAATKVKQSLDSIIESLSKLFDWIEVRVQRYEENIDLNKAKADNATNYQSKNAYISNAQTYTNKLIDVQEQAVAKYQKQADTVAKQVGLSASLKKKVDNGTINIQSLSEDNKKRVEQYKQWVDKAKSAAQAVEDLKQQQKELAQTKLDNIVEQYESITGLAEAAQNTSKSLVDYLTSAGKEVNSNEAKNQLRSQMSQQNVITSNLQAQVNAYKAELANAAKVFGENSNEYRDSSTKLQELNQSLYESQTAYNDLNKQLFELDLSRIQYAIDNISSLSDKIKNVISLNEKRGSVITEADYTNQVKNNNSLIGMYYQDWNARKAKIAQEGWLPGSEQYQEYYKAIMKDEEAIYQLLEGNEDLKASIVSLRWKPFEDLQEKLSQSIDDFDYLRGLLNEEGFFDDNGKMTSQGYANIALLGESISTAKKQVADYRVALEKLQEEYDNGNITLDSYNERSRDYIDTIKSSISAIEDYKDALVDLYKTQITKENDALQESITLRKEALNKKKDYYDFDRQLKSKNKDINSLKAQIAALQGVTNQASIAELARLKEQLQDATDARDELVKDHEYEIKVSGYEKLSDDVQDALDKTLSELESNSQKQQEVVNMMLENIKSSYSSAYSEIQGIISNTGLVLGNEAQSAVNKLNELANAINLANSAQLAQSNVASSSQANGINTGTITTSTSNTNAIENAIGGDTAASIAQQTAIENARKAELERQRQAEEAARAKAEAEARARAEAEAAAATKAKAEAEAAAKLKAEQDKADKLAKVKKIIASNSVKGKVNNSTYKSHGNLWKYIYDKSGKSYVNITRKNMVAIGKVLGVTGLPSDPLKITDAKKDEILKALKAVGYKKGTKSVPNDGNYWTHDGEIIFRKADNAVLTPLKAKDAVVPANFADNLYKWGAINPERVMPTFDQQPEFKNNNMSIVNHYDSLLTVNGDVSKDTLPSLEVILKKSYEYTSREWYKEGKKMGYR